MTTLLVLCIILTLGFVVYLILEDRILRNAPDILCDLDRLVPIDPPDPRRVQAEAFLQQKFEDLATTQAAMLAGRHDLSLEDQEKLIRLAKRQIKGLARTRFGRSCTDSALLKLGYF